MSARQHFLTPLLDAGELSQVVRIERSGTLLATEVEAAFDSASRRTGLLGRQSLARGVAFIIAPCNSVHTFFMKFTIDVIFTDRSGVVVKHYALLRPWRLAFAWSAFAAVELAAGAIARSGIRVGDRLTLQTVKP